MVIRPLMADSLRRAAYDVVDVGTVHEALVQDGPWDLLLLDSVLPNGEGRRVAEHFAGVPTLYATAYPGTTPAQALVLAKPFTPVELLRVIRTILPLPGEEP